jgi:thiosulfate dehydrogenase (quinone) large subunit
VLTAGSHLQFNTLQQIAIALLRIAIGWHFMREGWVKLATPGWTAEGYLSASVGPFAPMMHYFLASEAWMAFINVMMPWALFLTGLGLMLGLFTRIFCLVGIGLLAMFYFAMPPWDYALSEAALYTTNEWSLFASSMQQAQWAGNQWAGSEGNYIIVNKNLIELLAIAVLLMLDSGKIFGFDAAIRQWFSAETKQEAAQEA